MTALGWGDWFCQSRQYRRRLELANLEQYSLFGHEVWSLVEPGMVSQGQPTLTKLILIAGLVPMGNPTIMVGIQFVFGLFSTGSSEMRFLSVYRRLSAQLDYIKWDMNRPLTDVFSLPGQLISREFFTICLGCLCLV